MRDFIINDNTTGNLFENFLNTTSSGIASVIGNVVSNGNYYIAKHLFLNDEFEQLENLFNHITNQDILMNSKINLVKFLIEKNDSSLIGKLFNDVQNNEDNYFTKFIGNSPTKLDKDSQLKFYKLVLKFAVERKDRNVVNTILSTFDKDNLELDLTDFIESFKTIKSDYTSSRTILELNDNALNIGFLLGCIYFSDNNALISRLEAKNSYENKLTSAMRYDKERNGESRLFEKLYEYFLKYMDFKPLFELLYAHTHSNKGYGGRILPDKIYNNLFKMFTNQGDSQQIKAMVLTLAKFPKNSSRLRLFYESVEDKNLFISCVEKYGDDVLIQDCTKLRDEFDLISRNAKLEENYTLLLNQIDKDHDQKLMNELIASLKNANQSFPVTSLFKYGTKADFYLQSTIYFNNDSELIKRINHEEPKNYYLKDLVEHWLDDLNNSDNVNSRYKCELDSVLINNARNSEKPLNVCEHKFLNYFIKNENYEAINSMLSTFINSTDITDEKLAVALKNAYDLIDAKGNDFSKEIVHIDPQIIQEILNLRGTPLSQKFDFRERMIQSFDDAQKNMAENINPSL